MVFQAFNLPAMLGCLSFCKNHTNGKAPGHQTMRLGSLNDLEMRTSFMHIHAHCGFAPAYFPIGHSSVLMKQGPSEVHQDHITFLHLLKSHDKSITKTMKNLSKSHEQPHFLHAKKGRIIGSFQVFSMRAKLPSEPGSSEDMQREIMGNRWE